MDRFLVGSEYASHHRCDLGCWSRWPRGHRPAVDVFRLRSDPVALLRLLEHPGAFRAVWRPG
jgi:hypothetical protein